MRLILRFCDKIVRRIGLTCFTEIVKFPSPRLTAFLKSISLQIPYIKMATNVSKNAIELIASPWSSPAWTKTNNAFNHGGFLKKEYYNYWAEYFVKFFEAYKKEGIRFWGVTVQNEPATGLAKSNINSIAWFPSQLVPK